jgi:hypothetical protein
MKAFSLTITRVPIPTAIDQKSSVTIFSQERQKRPIRKLTAAGQKKKEPGAGKTGKSAEA